MYKKLGIIDRKLVILLIASVRLLNISRIQTMADDGDRPNLIIESVEVPDSIEESETVEFIVQIKNIEDETTDE